MRKKCFLFTCCLFLLTGCAHYNVETRTLVDYRYIPEHTEVHSDKVRTKCPSCGKQVDGKVVAESHYYPEQFQLMWEYRYEDDHKERKWEDCTRFEYQKAKDELGEVKP